MAPIGFHALAILMSLGLASAALMDDFSALFRRPDRDPDFDYTVPGKCQLTGCSGRRGQPRVCVGPIVYIRGLRIFDDDGSNWTKGVKNCARACNREGKDEDGEFLCQSYVYRYDFSDNNCNLYANKPNRLLGENGGTRTDFTNHFCFVREADRVDCVGLFCPKVPGSIFD